MFRLMITYILHSLVPVILCTSSTSFYSSSEQSSEGSYVQLSSSGSSSSRYDLTYGTTNVFLVGGTSVREGRIELSGLISGTVCSDGWNDDDADQICKFLGFEGVEKNLVDFGPGIGNIWTDIIECIGFSSDCNAQRVTGDPQCTHANDVGIICLPVQIRLVDGKLPHEGRVEFYYLGDWSTISNLNIDEADVVCRSLGYPGAEFSDCCGIFGVATGMAAYTIDCVGSEQDISECNKDTSYYPNHQSGVRCLTDGVRLIDGDFDSDGRLEVYTDAKWHSVCSPDINTEAARIICRQLNFDDILSVSDTFTSNNQLTVSSIYCSGSESRFEECSFKISTNRTCEQEVFLSCQKSGSRFINGYSRNSGVAQTYFNNAWTGICGVTEDRMLYNSICLMHQSTGVGLIQQLEISDAYYNCVFCTAYTDELGCDSEQWTEESSYYRPVGYSYYYQPSYYYYKTECLTDIIRIRNGGHSGFLETYRNNNWTSVCNDHWSLQASEIACKELHFTGVGRTQPTPESSTLAPDAVVVKCEGWESSFLECQFDDSTTCGSTAVQLTCSDIGIRFGGSAVSYAGRVEVYNNNQWWTVCDDYWEISNAHVACKMAGYPEAVEAYQGATYGEGVVPIISNDFFCDGEEYNLFDCPSTMHYDGYCRHHEDASVICSTDFVRLADGSQSAGRVELFIDGQWGTVCDDNWDILDATVVCRQIGFDGATNAYSESRFGPGYGPILLDEVKCTGHESSIFECASQQRDHDCQHSEDAAVACFYDSSVTPSWLGPFNAIQTDGCNDNWFRDGSVCLTLIQIDQQASKNDCPSDSTFLTINSSLEILMEFVRILYFYEFDEPLIYLWEDSNTNMCWFLHRFNDVQNSWSKVNRSCDSNFNASVCQMKIIDQSYHCSVNQFKCSSGACILKSLVCDGNYDCPDRSDEEEQCIMECYQLIDGSDYRGTVDSTKDGTRCLMWTSNFKAPDSVFPADFVGKGIGDHNFCRNPNERRQPWCYSEVFNEVMDCDLPPKCSPDDISRPCQATSFKCASGHCITYSFYCDHKADCPDGSDEAECSFSNCTKSQIVCDNARCLDYSLKCNGIKDCMDGTDELKCAECSSDFLRCADGKCLHPKYKCDGRPDCPYGMDENNCPTTSGTTPPCSYGKMKCQNNICVDQRYMCILDYDQYMADTLTGCRDRSHLLNCGLFQCPAHTYKCPNSYCITIKSRCDGIADCENGEDEEFCDDYNCQGYFKCQDATNCISQTRVCDGVKDCIRGDDELFCDIQCPDVCTCSDLAFNCSGNEWTKENAELIPSNIRYLNLSRVTVKNQDKFLFIDPSMFKFIAVLDISGNHIEDLTSTFFDQLVHLKTLCIHENSLSKLSGDIFKDLSNLNYLDVHGSGIKSIDRMTFSRLKKLEYLDISGNDIREVDNDVFNGLKSLKRLVSDDFSFCCLLNTDMDVDCTPAADVFSSCDNLIQNEVLRAFLWIFGLSALIGNLFVILWRWRNWPNKKHPSYTQSFLITNLAVADILMGLYMLIIASADMHFRDNYVTHDRYWKESSTCNFAGFLAILSSESSVYTLVVISCDRFLHIAFPFRRFHLTPKTVKIAVGIGWVLTLTMSLLPLIPFPYFNNEFYGVTSVCLALPLTSSRVRGWEYTAAIFIGFNTFCFFLIFVCYTGVFILIKISSKKVSQTGDVNSVKKQHISLAIRMAFIVATDFLCWVPVLIMGILSLSGTAEIPPVTYAWTAVFVLPINSAINPYLYTIASLKKLQKQLKPSKHVHASESVPQTERSQIDKGKATCQSAVQKIEALIKSEKESAKDDVDARVCEYLSSALHLAKQREAGIIQVDVENSLQFVDTNNQSQENTQMESDYYTIDNPAFERDA